MSKTPNIVRRGIQGQAPEYALLGRLRGVGPVQFLTFDDVVTEMMSRGRLGQRIQGAAGGGASRQSTVVITSGNQTNVEFAAISQDFRNMTIKIRGQASPPGAGTERVLLRINNGATASGNYAWRQMLGTTVTNLSGGGQTEQRIGLLPQSTNAFQYGQLTCEIHDYTDTTTNKSLYSYGSYYASGQGVYDIGGLWNVTGAVTEIDIFLSAGHFVDGAMVELILET